MAREGNEPYAHAPIANSTFPHRLWEGPHSEQERLFLCIPAAENSFLLSSLLFFFFRSKSIPRGATTIISKFQTHGDALLDLYSFYEGIPLQIEVHDRKFAVSPSGYERANVENFGYIPKPVITAGFRTRNQLATTGPPYLVQPPGPVLRTPYFVPVFTANLQCIPSPSNVHSGTPPKTKMGTRQIPATARD